MRAHRLQPLSLLTLLFANACGDHDKGEPDTAAETHTTTGTDEDMDGDGYGIDEDCDDTNEDIYPGSTEICNGLDDDCDSDIDEGVTGTYYRDADGDGFGSPDDTIDACEAPTGYVPVELDCDDGDDQVSPAGTEICNEIDDNCDDQIDEGVQSAFYADADGDGYGDPDTQVMACELPSGASTDDQDCDDGDADVNPGTAELCDGKDNDCAPGTSEDGLVSFTDTTGFTTDESASFTGTSGNPVALTLSDDGTWTFCDGTWEVRLDVTANVTLTSVNGPTSTFLDASSIDSVVSVKGTGLTVTVDNLTLTNGYGGVAATFYGGYPRCGGGIACEGANDLVVSSSVVSDSYGQLGGGIFAEYCDAWISDSELTGNAAGDGGGGIIGLYSTITIEDSTLSGNTAEYFGGAGYAYYSTVSMLGTTNQLNEGDYGGAWAIANSAVSLDFASSVFQNTGTFRDGAFYLAGDKVGRLYSQGASWGTVADGDDNSTGDVFVYNDGWVVVYTDYGDDAWFICDKTSCESYVWTSATGDFNITTGYATTPATWDCDVDYTLSGTGASDVCEDCDFGFDLAWTRAASSTGSCAMDYDYSLAYSHDYNGYEYVFYGYGGDWAPLGPASWDGTTLQFGYGAVDEVSISGGTTYYGSDYYGGSLIPG